MLTKKIDLRPYSIFKINKNIPASVKFKIIDLFFFEELNAKKITDKINVEYKTHIYNYVVENLLKKLRLIIYSYMQDKYKTTMIRGFDALNRTIDLAIDENLLIHNSSHDQIWIIEGIETKSRHVRLISSKR